MQTNIVEVICFNARQILEMQSCLVSIHEFTCIYFHVHTFFCDPPSICQNNMHMYSMP